MTEAYVNKVTNILLQQTLEYNSFYKIVWSNNLAKFVFLC